MISGQRIVSSETTHHDGLPCSDCVCNKCKHALKCNCKTFCGHQVNKVAADTKCCSYKRATLNDLDPDRKETILKRRYGVKAFRTR